MQPTSEVQTIGVVSCAAAYVDDVPSEGLPTNVELDPGLADAMLGMKVGDGLFVIAVFDRGDEQTHQGSVFTPQAQGAFSTRSSCRPNRIGMTLSRVTATEGTTISFEWFEFADCTPVIDLKPFNWPWECSRPPGGRTAGTSRSRCLWRS